MAFDPVRYPRAVAEQTVELPERLLPQPTALLAATQALVAVGSVEEFVAQQILDEHEEVLRCRDPKRGIRWTREWPEEPLTARRVALGTGEEVLHRGGIDPSSVRRLWCGDRSGRVHSAPAAA